VRIHQERAPDFAGFTIEKPLWVFVGKTVSKVGGGSKKERTRRRMWR
jgi:hypothetical protein